MDRPNMEVNTTCLIFALIFTWYGWPGWTLVTVLVGVILPVFFPNEGSKSNKT